MIDYTNLAYVLAAILFILGIKKLSSPKTARNGNAIASVGMLIAIVATLVSDGNMDYQTIAIGMIIGAIIGAFFAIKVEMTQMPQMVAIFNGFGGGASALVAAA
jgi:NAD(P) transhydrogenase subunit beta